MMYTFSNKIEYDFEKRCYTICSKVIVYNIHQVLTGVTLSMYSKYEVLKIVFFFLNV